MGKTTQQTSQSSSPPPQVLQNYQDLVNRATGVSNTPYQQYPGQIVAPSTQDQLASYENLSNLYGQATPYINQAAQYTQNAATPIQTTQGAIQPYQNPFATAGANAATTAGQGIANYGTNAANGMAGLAQNVATQGPQLQQFSSAAIDQYMNPYTQNVIDRTMANINRQNGIQQNDLASRGIMGGNAFGGDRLGVTSAELARNQDMSRDSIIANLLSSGYGQAVSQFNTGNQQALAGQQTALQGLGSAGQLGVGAQQAGGNLGLAGQNLGAQGFQNATQNAFQTQQANAQNNLAAGSQYANLGNQALGSQLTAANAQLQSGSLQQQQAQNQINAQYQQWLQQQAYPFQTTQFLGNLVMGTGNASGQNTTTTSPGPNVGSQILGLGAMGLGAFLSDERAKENIEPVGKMFDGQSIYRFNYKGEPRTQMGLIAQDVERSHPYAVSEHGGMKMVDYAAATEKAAEKGKFAGGGTVPNLASGAPGLFQPIDFTQGGVRGYVPDSQMPQTRPLQTPALPKPADNSMAPGMGTAAMAIGKGLAGMGGATGGLGATSAMGDPTGLGGLYANGGFVPPYSNGMIPRLAFGGGFSDLTFRPDRDGVYTDDLVYRPGTDPARFMPASDVFGDENRAAGYDLLRKGFGVQSPGSIPGGEPAPEPFRLDPGAMQKWRNGVDADAARGMTAPEPSAPTAFAQAAPLPQARPAGLGAPPLPPQITGPAPQPETALAYDQPRGLAPPGAAPPAPQMPPQGAPQGAIPPSIGQALMAAGAGMMASRNPTLLGGIGEGSALGIANYSAQQKAYNELDAHPVVDHSGPTTRIYYPSTKQWIDTGIPTISAAQKAQLEETKRARTAEERRLTEAERHNKATENKATWGVIGEDPVTGAKRYGWIDPSDKSTTSPAQDTPARSESNLTGEEYLKTLPPDQASLVKKVANYEMDPKLLSVRGGHRERILAAASRVNPEFDSSLYPQRFAVQKDFTSGKTSQNLASFNTAIGHLDSLEKSIDKLGNYKSSIINKATGAISEQYDTKYQESLKEFRTAKTAVADELTRAFRGSGGNVHDIVQWEKAISETDSPQALRSAVRTAVDLLKSRIEAIGDNYNRGMGTTKNGIELLSPKSKKAIDRLEHAGEETKKAETASSNKPSLKDFLEKAKEANPSATEQQLTDYYNKKYGS